MTTLEEALAAVTFVRGPTYLITAIRGPAWAQKIVRDEIERRVKDPPKRPKACKRSGQCPECGIVTPDHVSGWCNLCNAVVQKALKKAGLLT